VADSTARDGSKTEVIEMGTDFNNSGMAAGSGARKMI
jgi:hypothetical protein